MSFTVESSARDLMLEPEDLKEIFEAFFEDAVVVLAEAEEASQNDDTATFCKRMHSLKGSALNLRMDVLGELAKQAEKDGASVGETQRGNWLLAIHTEVTAAKEIVNRYYGL